MIIVIITITIIIIIINYNNDTDITTTNNNNTTTTTTSSTTTTTSSTTTTTTTTTTTITIITTSTATTTSKLFAHLLPCNSWFWEASNTAFQDVPVIVFDDNSFIVHVRVLEEPHRYLLCMNIIHYAKNKCKMLHKN